jgi:hypothetical protein
MGIIYIAASVWFVCAAMFCLALAVAARREIPEMAQGEGSNIIPLESYARLTLEDNQVFLDESDERKAA